MAGKSATQRTLEYLKIKGYNYQVVERWNHFAKRRQDLFGIIDIIAMNGYQVLGIQSCGKSFSDHDKKILESPYSKEWVKSGCGLVLIGWRKVKKVRGGKQMVWKPRIKMYSVEDFTDE